MLFKRYYKSMQELRGFTSIDISSKTTKEIETTLDEYKQLDSNPDDDLGLPIKEGVIISRCLELDDMPSIFKQEADNTKITYYFKISEKDGKLLVLWEEYALNFKDGSAIGLGAYEVLIGDTLGDIKTLDYEDKYNPPIFDIVRRKITSENKKSSLAFLMSSLMYISIVQSNRNVVYRQSKGVSFNSNSKASKTKTTKVEVLNGDKVMYIMNGNESIIKGFRNYTRKTESWSVIGHWRKYKNGTKKWINSYVKGIGKPEPKHYKVK